MCPETRSSDEAQLKSMEKTRENAVEVEKKAHAPHETCKAYAQDRVLSGGMLAQWTTDHNQQPAAYGVGA